MTFASASRPPAACRSTSAWLPAAAAATAPPAAPPGAPSPLPTATASFLTTRFASGLPSTTVKQGEAVLVSGTALRPTAPR